MEPIEDIELIDVDDVEFYNDPSTNEDDYVAGFDAYVAAVVPKDYTKEQMNTEALNFKDTENASIRERLILSNVKRVNDKAKEFAEYYDVDKKELNSQGYLRLITLVEEFKKGEKQDFNEVIEQGLNRCMESGVATKKGVPPEYVSIIWKAKDLLQRENGTTPTIEEVLNYIGQVETIPAEVKEDIAKQFRVANSTSLDELRDSGKDIVSNEATPQSIVEEDLTIKGINAGINNLPPMGVNGTPGFMETIQNAAPVFEEYKDYTPKVEENPFASAHEVVQSAMEQAGFHYNPETDDPSIELIDVYEKESKIMAR